MLVKVAACRFKLFACKNSIFDINLTYLNNLEFSMIQNKLMWDKTKEGIMGNAYVCQTSWLVGSKQKKTWCFTKKTVSLKTNNHIWTTRELVRLQKLTDAVCSASLENVVYRWIWGLEALFTADWFASLPANSAAFLSHFCCLFITDSG